MRNSESRVGAFLETFWCCVNNKHIRVSMSTLPFPPRHVHSSQRSRSYVKVAGSVKKWGPSLLLRAMGTDDSELIRRGAERTRDF